MQHSNDDVRSHGRGHGHAGFAAVIPLIFMVFDGGLLVSSFLVGFVGMCAVNIASISVHLQQFLSNQRNNIKTIYDVSNIDFPTLFQCISEMSDQLDSQRLLEIDNPGSPYSMELLTAIRLATERVLFNDETEDTDTGSENDIEIIETDDDDDDEQLADRDSIENYSHSSDTSRDDKNACTISATSSDIEEDSYNEEKVNGSGKENENEEEEEDTDNTGNESIQKERNNRSHTSLATINYEQVNKSDSYDNEKDIKTYLQDASAVVY
jgi:hypothetical protein